MKNETKILCTLGPSSMDPKTIKKLALRGADIFRINLSHTKSSQIEKAILDITQTTEKPLCIDLEGAQIRSGVLEGNNVLFKTGSSVKVTGAELLGNLETISLSPGFVVEKIEPGDLIGIDFDTLLLQVYEKQEDSLLCKVISGGVVGSNKAVTVDRQIDLPPFSEKDLKAIQLGLQHKVPYVALSFANRKADVDKLRDIVGDKMKIISKIESKEGLRNLDEILASSDAVLLDRGDMSREVSIERIPVLQKRIIKSANNQNVPVYVATNLLESMVNQKLPTRAEVNDIVNTLLDGADGLVLAAETAIGKYPKESVTMVSRIIKAFRSSADLDTVTKIANHQGESFSLVPPHGGKLVDRTSFDHDPMRLQSLRKLFVDEKVILDAEQIAIGSYSPIEGFMDRKEINRVLDEYKLLDGTTWTLPIVLQTKKEDLENFRIGDEVALVYDRDEQIYAVLHLEDIYKFDFKDVAMKWYRTDDLKHPGVKLLKENGEYFLGGKIDLVRRLDTPLKQYTLTPLQTRHIFEKKGWNKIVGFHTRNVIHRAHEYIQLSSLDKFGIDGLFLHPIIGPKKKNDYNPEVILKSYALMVEKFYPRDSVFLGGFLSYSRYAGPREAVFTALCRKNFGCTHFVVGRDHTGVGSFYSPGDSHKLFDDLGDILIKPIYFNEVYFCGKCNKYVDSCDHGIDKTKRISGSQARAMFQEGQMPPEWFMRPEISQLVLDEIKNNREVFVS